MDIARRREEAGQYRRQPRLVEESEVPSSILKQSQLFTEAEERRQLEGDVVVDVFADSSRRKRKEVNYSQVCCHSIIHDHIICAH